MASGFFGSTIPLPKISLMFLTQPTSAFGTMVYFYFKDPKLWEIWHISRLPNLGVDSGLLCPKGTTEALVAPEAKRATWSEREGHVEEEGVFWPKPTIDPTS